MTIEQKRGWVLMYYEQNPPSVFVVIDDADMISEAVQKYVFEELGDGEIEEIYEKYKGTKDGVKTWEWVIGNTPLYYLT